VTSPNCSLAVGLGDSSSASTGGGTGASCSATTSNREISESFSQSESGKCP
jgi:hypothetical protein